MLAKVHPELFQLLCLWYGGTRKPQNPPSHNQMVQLWASLWFSKRELQKYNDQRLKVYEPLCDSLLDYEPKSPLDKLGLIILWDQITRNIFRGTPRAYQYDPKALALAKELRSSSSYQNLPVHFKLAICICFLHSENLSDQEANKVDIKALESRLDEVIFRALYRLWFNHWDRVRLFGRIPERNSILNRQSTPEQIEYLSNMEINT